MTKTSSPINDDAQILVGLIMGSDSDLPVLSGAADLLKEFGVTFETRIVSAHRTPEWMVEYAKSAEDRGIQIIIAGAGGAAHLPGMVASLTTLPVIGVPVRVGNLEGLDALLSVVQMPRGVPVATVAVDNAFNAGLLAVRILSLKVPKLGDMLKEYQKRQADKVMQADARVQGES